MLFHGILPRLRGHRSVDVVAVWLVMAPATVLPLAGILALHTWQLPGTPLVRGLGLGALLVAAGATLGLLVQVYLRQRRETEDLEAFTRKLLSTLDVRELTATIIRETGKLVGADGVAIATVGHGDVLVVSTASSGVLAGFAGQPLPLEGSLAGWCVRTGGATIANDAGRDPRGFVDFARAGVVKHVIAAPLEIGGERFGTILASRGGRRALRFRKRELRIWGRMAQTAALALSNARLYERAVARRRRMEELQAFAASVVGTLDRQKVFDAVTERAARILEADAASFVLSDRDDVVYQSRFGPEEFAPGFRLLAEDSLAGTVVREGRAVRISDISQDARYNRLRMATATQAVLAVPVWMDGVALGSLGVLQYAARQFTDDDEELLRQLAEIAASVLRSAAAFEAEHRAHRRFLSLFRAMPDGALLVGRDGRIELANPAAERLLGVPSGALAQASIAGFAADAAELRTWLFSWDHNRSPRRGQLLRADRETREVEWRANRLDGDDKRVLCAVRDLTDELKQTAELRTLEAAVRAMRDGVVLVDAEGMIRFVNEAAVRIHGYDTIGDLVGKPVDVLVPEEDVATVASLLPVMQSDGWVGEGRGRHRTGRALPIQLAVSPIRQGERTVGVVGVLADLTERRQLEQRAAVGEKLATLGRLVAGTAHEINNPLTAVLSNAQLALEMTPATESTRDLLEVIVNETRRAGQIVKGMLSFARQRPVDKRAFDLRQTVDEVLRLRRGYHQSLGIDVTVEVAERQAKAIADPDQLKQVLLNLVVNAEYAVRNAAARRLRLSVQRAGSGCRIVIEDSGPGVPEALRGKIFEPFFTTKPEGEGSGLGLSVSYGIVREHGGHIWVEDSDLGGARFVVELPAGRPSAQMLAIPEPTAAEDPAAPAASRRVLVVDDEEPIRSSARRILQRFGHEVDVAADGRAALLLLEAVAYDVIFCDIRMPNMGGAELYLELKRRGILPSARFIVTTGDIADPETEQFLSENELPVLLKPFELKSIVSAIAA